MTKASPVRHNETILGSKRTAHRQFLLKPLDIVNQVVLYVIAVEAQENNLSIHALVGMSNHLHEVLTDADAQICDFYRNVHSNIAKALNCRFKRSDNLWSTKKPNRVACVTPDSVIDKMAYAMANPVAAFLVRYGHQWPGIRMAWPAKPVTIKRPNFYFRGPKVGGKWPDEVTLTFDRPPGFDDLSDDELAKRIVVRTDELEEAARDKAAKEGICFLGRKRIMKISRYEEPRTREPWFQIAPVVASKDKVARMTRIADNRIWDQRYVVAKDKYVAGDREVVFPYGTYQLPRHYGARVEPRLSDS